MVDDFNNVQDQNLVDDQMMDQINQEPAAGGSVGSVVHPQPPAVPAGPPVDPVSPMPAAPSQPAQSVKPAAAPGGDVPTAQQLLGDKLDELETNDLPDEPEVELPEPKLPPASVDESASDNLTDDNSQDVADDDLPAMQDDDAPVDHSDAEPTQDSEEEDFDKNENDDSQQDDSSDDESSTPLLQPKNGSGDDEELKDVKRQALEELSPLVSSLELPAEEKFETYLEILRASDDKTLVKPALEIAKTIEDDHKRAQALRDVVNEVNYLTRDHNSDNQDTD